MKALAVALGVIDLILLALLFIDGCCDFRVSIAIGEWIRRAPR